MTPRLVEHYSTISHAVLSVFLLLIILLALVRLFGPRSFAKFTPIDFAVTVCVGSILSAVIMTKDTSITKGALVIITLLSFQGLYGIIRIYFPTIGKHLTNKPLYLYVDNAIQEKALKKIQMTKDQLTSKLRLAGYGSFDDIYAIIIESTGDIAIIDASNKIDPKVFDDVTTA